MTHSVVVESVVHAFEDDKEQDRGTNLLDLILSSVKLDTKIDSLDGVCGCVCISDCSCDPSCLLQ